MRLEPHFGYTLRGWSLVTRGNVFLLWLQPFFVPRLQPWNVPSCGSSRLLFFVPRLQPWNVPSCGSSRLLFFVPRLQPWNVPSCGSSRLLIPTSHFFLFIP